MTVLVLASLLYSFRLVPDLLLPEKVPPHAALSFDGNSTLNKWTSLFSITTASGARYELQIDYSRDTDFDTTTLQVLLAVNWMADNNFGSLRIYGVRTPAGELDGVKSLVVLNRGVGKDDRVLVLRSVDGVRVEVRADARKTAPGSDQKPLPKGPDHHCEAFVEFDFSTLPIASPGEVWDVAFGVHVRPGIGDGTADVTIVMDVASIGRLQTATELLNSLRTLSCKAELIGPTKLRVYGWVSLGCYYPAHRGSVESEDLQSKDLPKVKNAGS